MSVAYVKATKPGQTVEFLFFLCSGYSVLQGCFVSILVAVKG